MSKSLLLHYAILLLLLLGAGALIIVIPGATIHWAIIAAIGLTYLIWAIWHHHQSQNLNKEAIMEYLCIIAIIVLVLLLL
jgi:hypothetical protein